MPSDLVLRRLFSLSGVVPLGVFVVVHFVALARALWGARSFEAGLSSGSRLRLIGEALVIGLPLAFHALLGARIALTSRINVARYPYSSNWSHAFTRVSGFASFAFLGWHLWEMRIRVLLGQRSPADFYTDLAGSLSATGALGIPWLALAYLAGVGFVSLHLANGVSGFAASFGLVHSEAEHKKLALGAAGFGLLLFALGSTSVIFFATGWSPL